MDVVTFRASFPPFTESLFPDGQVTFWLKFAGTKCPTDRWGDDREMGVFLLTAHHLTLAKAAAKAGDGTGGMDAAQGGVVSESKSVGGISKSIGRAGAAATGDIKATHYNDTIYGKQYWDMVQIVGAGGIVV